MKRIICFTAVVGLASCGTAASAKNAKKGAANSKSSFAAIQIECLKQNGGWYDEATKKWMISAPYYHIGGKADAVNSCIAQRTGRAGQYLREETYRP